MATTTNFGWETPDDTDLVKDGALAMRTLGNSIDSSFVDLKGGTTGQILTKNSNTDLDFTWSAPNPGDITAVTAGTGLTGGGTSGAVTLNFDVANFGGGTFAAGKNKIINGDFGIWQRGTSITLPSSFAYTYTADRFECFSIGAGASVSRQSFTPGTAPVAGYEGQFFLRYVNPDTSVGHIVRQKIEDVRTFAGQTITVSFWAKAASNLSFTAYNTLVQNFGSGGSSDVNAALTMSPSTITTSWQRFTATVSVPSISGKTIGTGSFLTIQIGAAGNNTLDIWGVQAEAGNTATAFQTATGTLAGELAACRYYYERILPNGGTGYSGVGHYYTSTNCFTVQNYQQKRVVPTVTFSNNTHFTANGAGVNRASTAVVLDIATTWGADYYVTTSSTTAGNTAIVGMANASAFIEVSAEL